MFNFKYTALNEGEIRIIELQPGDDIPNIQGSLKVASIGSSTPKQYSALSYCWGPDSQPRRTISLDDQWFEVRQSLLGALQQLRSRDECARLWIDAICINQEDEEEKKSQLPLMSSIYSKAETVEIWLGTGEDNGELGLRSLASGELEAIATPRIVGAVIHLLQRPWFSRTWVIQELVLAGEGQAFVNCGNARVSWDALSLGIAEISSTLCLNGAFLRGLVPQKEQHKVPPTAPGSDFELALLRNMLSAVMVSRGMAAMMLCGIRTAYSDRSAASRPKPNSAVGAILRSSRYAQATLPRDKIFGLCGLLGASAVEGLMKSFDKAADEVFFAATLHILQNDTHPNMYHEYPTIPPSRAEKSSVPSWTLDFSFTGTTYAELRFTSLTKFHVARERQDKLIFSSDAKELTVDVCIIDTITNVIDHAAVARVPDTPAAWDAFSLRFREAAGIDKETVLEMSWYDRYNVQSFVDGLNLIALLENALELYQQRPACPATQGTAASFWTAVVSGLVEDHGNGAGMALPDTSQLAEHGEILLGLRNAAAATPNSRLNELIAQALRLPDPKGASAAVTRQFHAPALFAGLQQALVPRGCNVLSGFYVTSKGLYGLCLPGAQAGDVIARLFRGTGFEIPMVLRPKGHKRYSVVCAASVLLEGWEEVCRVRKTVDPEEVVLV